MILLLLLLLLLLFFFFWSENDKCCATRKSSSGGDFFFFFLEVSMEEKDLRQACTGYHKPCAFVFECFVAKLPYKSLPSFFMQPRLLFTEISVRACVCVLDNEILVHNSNMFFF